MATLDLHLVDELIEARQQQHGGGRGAPQIFGGHRIGASLNRSCIVMLSALLQAYVEEEFKEAAVRTFPVFVANPQDFEDYWRQMNRWGNPSATNIKNLFIHLGVADIFDGLGWQGTTTQVVRQKLDALNRIRNQIAHGDRQLVLNGTPYSLSLAKVIVYRNLAENFATRFTAQVQNAIF